MTFGPLPPPLRVPVTSCGWRGRGRAPPDCHFGRRISTWSTASEFYSNHSKTSWKQRQWGADWAGYKDHLFSFFHFSVRGWGRKFQQEMSGLHWKGVAGEGWVPAVPSPLILSSSVLKAFPSSVAAQSTSLRDLRRINLIRNPESTHQIQRISECQHWTVHYFKTQTELKSVNSNVSTYITHWWFLILS